MSITEKQEYKDNIELLAAQKNIYSRAKNIIGIQMLLSVPVSFGAVVLSATKPSFGNYVAILGILIVLLDLLLLTPWIKTLQELGARTQELFDTKVFSLKWNSIAVGKRPSPEDIHEEVSRHGTSEEKVKKLKEWYPISISQVPSELAVIICQRSNIWWDSKMRRKFALYIRLSLFLIALGLGFFAIHENKGLLECMVFFATLLPTYVFGYRQMREHEEAAATLDRLKEHSEHLWERALNGENPTVLTTESRSLQDQIFNHRKNNPPIFDFIFFWFRDKNEVLMNKGANVLVDEYKTRKHT